jgi:hypothetical protein
MEQEPIWHCRIQLRLKACSIVSLDVAKAYGDLCQCS